jgi:hypothetical protein
MSVHRYAWLVAPDAWCAPWARRERQLTLGCVCRPFDAAISYWRGNRLLLCVTRYAYPWTFAAIWASSSSVDGWRKASPAALCKRFAAIGTMREPQVNDAGTAV